MQMRIILIATFYSLLNSLVYADSTCVELELWGKKHTYSSTSDLKAHPCGGIKTICVNTISETEKLEPSWAYELSIENRKIIHKWPIPVDSQVYSIYGEKLTVASPNYNNYTGGNAWDSPRFFRIELNGRVEQIKPIAKEYLDPFKCPVVEGEKGIEHMWCYKFKHSNKTKIRVIAVSGVCS